MRQGTTSASEVTLGSRLLRLRPRASSRVVWTAGIGLLVVLFLLLAASKVGGWLVVEDRLQPVDAIVVLGGHLPFRALEAGELYRRGIGGEVWLMPHDIHVEDRALAELGLFVPQEFVHNKAVLEKVGVPSSAIRIMRSSVHTTQEELRFVSTELERRKLSRVAIVTSKFHARRVRTIWDVSIGNRFLAVVRTSPRDPYNPERWWRHSGDAFLTLRELFGIANVWASYPIPSHRR